MFRRFRSVNRLNKYRKHRAYKYAKIRADSELKRYFDISEEPQHRRWMIQYSKILTSIILVFTVVINVFYFVYIVPKSGSLSITDSAMEASAMILKVWNAGTIIFFCGYFAKSLFETKFDNTGRINKEKFDRIMEECSSDDRELGDTIKTEMTEIIKASINGGDNI